MCFPGSLSPKANFLPPNSMELSLWDEYLMSTHKTVKQQSKKKKKKKNLHDGINITKGHKNDIYGQIYRLI